MSFVEIIETSGFSRRRRHIYLAAMALVYVGTIAFTAARIAGSRDASWRSGIVDFHDFYLVAHLVSSGGVDSAYSLARLVELQRAMFGDTGMMPWAYPPQFDLLLWPLAQLPIWLAYALFAFSTFVAYTLTIRRLAPGRLATLLMLIGPTTIVTLRCGQNGFLTGALIGMSAIGLLERRGWAGAPLGFMIIKPHLAIAFALHVLLTRRWNVVLIAALVVLLTSALATAALGPGVWAAFLHGAEEASSLLERGLYPNFRMVSSYALIRSLGFSAFAGSVAQLMIAAVAVLATCFAMIRFSQRQAIGVAAIASVMISPYAYDYDLPVFAVGIAILLDDLIRYGALHERFALYTILIGVQLISFILAARFDFAGPAATGPISVGCVTVLATLAIVWKILERSRAGADSSPSVIPAAAPAH
jgi:Glycosyltransferase family 87